MFLLMFCFFSKPLKTFILEYLTLLFEGLGIQRTLILRLIFAALFDLIFGPPFGQLFGQIWGPEVPILRPPVDFGTFLRTPWVPNGGLWHPRAR